VASEKSNAGKESEQHELLPDLLHDYQDGRDELNLAEFPISAIGNRFDSTVKTLKFEDTAFDKASGEVIHRKLTITASDEYGLPSTADDEVLLGLLQLSRIQKFKSSTVVFTPYQLLKILGWQVSTHNYRRLRESINRWLGVTLHYENAWRDKNTGAWIDAGFHFIDFVEFHKPGHESALAPDGYSVIRWNDLVFKNFREGNLKTLDFHRYRELKSGIAKRMFRFLDKRFYLRSRLSFELEAFACDKIGLTRPMKVSSSGVATLDIAQIKRRLLPALQELQEARFIVSVPPELRFTKDTVGKWHIHFEHSSPSEDSAPSVEAVEDISLNEGRLLSHGVVRSQAKRLVAEFDEERIERQLDALEYLLGRKDGAPENRAGWLVKAIEDDYGLPRGFKTRQQLEREAKEKAERARDRGIQARRRVRGGDSSKADGDGSSAQFKQEQEQVEAYLKRLSPQQREQLESDAIAKSPLNNGRLPMLVRQTIIYNHVVSLLKAGVTAPPKRKAARASNR
jgi:hypothetical protein